MFFGLPRSQVKLRVLGRRSLKGFTIVELLIVIVVVGILASLVVTTYAGVQTRSKDVYLKNDIRVIYQAMESYRADYGSLPPTSTDLYNYLNTRPGPFWSIWTVQNPKGINGIQDLRAKFIR